MQIGFSTGVLYKTSISPISAEALQRIASLGCSAVELAAMRLERIPQLAQLSAKDCAPFSYRSIHAPGSMELRNDKPARELFDSIERAYRRLGLQCVVVHPHTVQDWSLFKRYSFVLAVENMDPKKPSGRFVDDLRAVFDQTDARFVLDLNHCFAHDPTLKLADELLAAFGNRLQHIHLSGYQKLHEPLHITRQSEIVAKALSLHVPVIIESELNAPEDLDIEYQYVMAFLPGAGNACKNK